MYKSDPLNIIEYQKQKTMQIPFLDLKVQYKSIKTEIDSAIQGILDSSAFVLGKAVADFETEFAKAHNVQNCVALNSGTAGNHVATWALGIKPGDEVIVPANTFIATAWGATLCGARPVFVDCEPDSYNINPGKIESAVSSKTKAVVAVHLYGQPADMDSLLEVTRQHDLFLIEDAAQSHVAEYKGKKIGGFGEAASFSFYPGKNLGAYGEGGAVLTNNTELAKRARMIRDHGTLQKYQHEIFGHNYRMEGLQGAVLEVKLKYLSDWTESRRRVAEKYKEMLSGIEQIILPVEMPYAKHVYHLFVIQVRGKKEEYGSSLRDKLAVFLKEKGIATGMHYPIPLHLQDCFKHLGYKKGDFPNTEKLAETGLSLPIFPELNDEQIEYVCSNIKSFFIQSGV